MVSGLDTQTNITDIGMLALKIIANAAATIICPGIGIKAQNKPTATARATERRLRCQRLGSWPALPNIFKNRFFLSASRFGNSLFNNFLGMDERKTLLMVVCRIVIMT